MAVELAFERNLGFFTEEEQHMLGRATVAIAGAGGDGGMLAVQLARLGVGAEGGEIRLADPDPFEEENLNRQECCTYETIGENKALAVGAYIQSINSDIKVRAFTDGVTPSNVEKFVQGADLLIDETEFTIHSIGTLLARSARAEGIANLQVLNVGFGAQLTAYDPKSEKYSFERRLGLKNDTPIDEVAKAEVSVDKWLAYLPSYADEEMFRVVAEGKKSAPSVAPGVAIAASIGATQAVLHLLRGQNNRPEPVMFPRTQVYDTMLCRAKTVRFPRIGFTLSALRMTARSRFKQNPATSY